MKKIVDYFVSMQFALTLLLVFVVAIAMATFIENDFGTTVAKGLVYGATWMEILLLILSLSLIGTILKYRLIQKKKWLVLIFHLAFVIILLGGAITRFFSFEGTMIIREGATSNQIITSDHYVQVTIRDGEQVLSHDKQAFFYTKARNHFKENIRFGDKNCTVKYVNYLPNVGQTVEEDPNGEPIITLITIDQQGRKYFYLKQGDSITFGDRKFFFNSPSSDTNAFQFRFKDGALTFEAPLPVVEMAMELSTTDTLEAHASYPLGIRRLYSFDDRNFVIRSFMEKGKVKLISAPADQSHNLKDAITFNLEFEGLSKEVVLYTSENTFGEPVTTSINGADFTIAYGQKTVTIPFSIKLNDFKLERYPGSISPSSFMSEVTLIDQRKNLEEQRRIFMNNVLNYSGYRFYQSSYDNDEKGTILSVNHDFWGTYISYAGYFLMTAGLILNLFSKKSRFRQLINLSTAIRQKSKGITAVILIAILSGLSVQAIAGQDERIIPTKGVTKKHADAFGKLLIQDQQGRIKPLNTMASEILRKVSRLNDINGLNPDQVMLGMLTDPETWQKVPMIKISDPTLKNILDINGKYATFSDLFDMENMGKYLIGGYVDAAYNKKPALRNAFDKDVIKVDERLNICYMIYSGSMMKLFPKPGDLNNTWYSDINAEKDFDSTERILIKTFLPRYYASITEAIKTGDWNIPNQNLSDIRSYQEKYGKAVFPSPSKVKGEVLYNDLNIFKRLFPVYSLLGFILLIFVFISMLSHADRFKTVIRILIALIVIAFILHTLGLILRWYVAGHAPWSNGFETMIYIGWGIVLSGLIFAKRSKITLAVTAILASLTLMVANMSWMDPEITNLVPVLKSYWLVIHVAVITASYSFLAIGAILGFTNLLLMIFQNEKNYKRIKLTIEELSNINEINLMIGLVLVSIGTFLGAVWANESWGRYWGWDPKETWALITMLVYSFVTHMRLIPGLRGTFTFNFAALISFSSVLMTYFGVNYYLSGLHSYASGDPVPVPAFVYYAAAIIIIVTLMAYRQYRRLNKGEITEEEEISS
ncbi:MAG: c-type cytochrome biogenesis protein CcsB [Bacteroidetes bacterium]|nr:c-type cytochrome biogenesis protein CcsB [Bacteroidota bacterium]